MLLATIAAGRGEAVAAQLRLTWDDNSGDEVGFSIERSTGTAGAFEQIAVTGPGITSYTDSSVAAGTAYCYRVRSFNGAGYSPYTDTACATASAAAVGLAVVKMGEGSGAVTSDPAGIDSGPACAASYADGGERMNGGRSPVMDGLVEFVLGLGRARIAGDVIEAAERSVTDWMGTAVRGAAEPLAGALASVIGSAGGEGQATVLGRGTRTSALWASLANGAQSHALDFDDTHLPSIVHGSAAVTPAVLALGEWRHLSGERALTAFVAGFEVQARIGRVIGRALADRGWHVTGVLGHFGAAAAAGKLLELDARALAQALGIAGTQAAGLEASFGTMSKPLHPGKAAMDGLLAALLAREGFTGPTAVLDGPGGIGATFVGAADLGAAVEDLGTRFEILENSTKPYAACHLTHASIDAARAIRARVAPAPDSVESVECHVHPLVMKVAANPAPRAALEAKFSVAFCAAIGLVRGLAGEAEFGEESLRDPAVARVMARVVPRADASLGVGAARMTVRLADGRALEERITAARGMPGNALTRDELEAKFRGLAGVVLPGERVERLLTALRGLAGLPDVAALAALAAG